MRRITQASFSDGLGVGGSSGVCVPLDSVSDGIVGRLGQFTTFGGPSFCDGRTVHVSACGVPHVVYHTSFGSRFLIVPQKYRRTVVTVLSSLDVSCRVVSGAGRNGSVTVTFGNGRHSRRLRTVGSLVPRAGKMLSTAATFKGAIATTTLVTREGVGALVLMRSGTLLVR